MFVSCLCTSSSLKIILKAEVLFHRNTLGWFSIVRLVWFKGPWIFLQAINYILLIHTIHLLIKPRVRIRPHILLIRLRFCLAAGVEFWSNIHTDLLEIIELQFSYLNQVNLTIVRSNHWNNLYIVVVSKVSAKTWQSRAENVSQIEWVQFWDWTGENWKKEILRRFNILKPRRFFLLLSFSSMYV